MAAARAAIALPPALATSPLETKSASAAWMTVRGDGEAVVFGTTTSRPVELDVPRLCAMGR